MDIRQGGKLVNSKQQKQMQKARHSNQQKTVKTNMTPHDKVLASQTLTSKAASVEVYRSAKENHSTDSRDIVSMTPTSQLAAILLFCMLSAILCSRSQARNKKDVATLRDFEFDGYVWDSSVRDASEIYRSLACLVCCWATCHLSFPMLIFSWHKALPKSILVSLATDHSVPIIIFQAAVATGFIGSFVYDFCGHLSSSLFCPFVASAACLVIELFALSPPSSAEAFGWPLGVLIGSAVCMHINAIISVSKLVHKQWVPAVALIMFGGVVEGFSDLNQLCRSESAAFGSPAGSTGMYGTWALKSASIGFMCSAQGALYASLTQNGMLDSSMKSKATLNSYMRQGGGMLLSRGCLVPMFAQAFLIFVGSWPALSRLPVLREQASSSFHTSSWDESNLHLCLGAWAVLLPAWVSLAFPDSHQSFLSCAFFALLGGCSLLQAQLTETTDLWHMRSISLCVAMLIFAMCGAVVDVLVQKKKKEVCEEMQRLDMALEHQPWHNFDEQVVFPDEACLMEIPTPAFEDPLAALFAPDADDTE